MKHQTVVAYRALSRPLCLLWMSMLSLATTANAQAPSCKALVRANNQLYLSAENGPLAYQFPTDTRVKSNIGLSPDGMRVVFISNSNPNAYTLADTTGRVVEFAVPASAKATFTEIGWDSANVIRLRYHLGRDKDIFEFYAVPPAFSSPLTKLGNGIAGASCAMKAAETATACISENMLVAGKKILIDQDPLSPNTAALLTSAQIMAGTSFTTQTQPSFQIRVQDISAQVGLLITLPDGSWAQSRVPVGEAFVVKWDDISYGFTPSSVDGARHKVLINVSTSNGQAVTFDPALTWTMNNYVAAVTHNTSGAQLLLTKSSGNQVPMAVSLGAIGQVTSITYSAQHLLMLRTAAEFVAVPVNPHGNVSSLKIGAIRKLPVSLNLSTPAGSVPGSVEGWACP